jgi:nitrogen regulatory protein P-II 1
MKLVSAIIQPDRLDAVREALMAAQIARVTVYRVSGRGKQAEENLFRGEVIAPHLISKVRLDIACQDKQAPIICQAIIKGARHGDGKVGDGKIFVIPLDECIRIRTGENGPTAL